METEIRGHTYKIDHHPTTEATGLALSILSSLSEPAVSLIATAVQEKEKLDEDEHIVSILDHIDEEKAGRQLRSALSSLDAEELRDLFRYTQRDDKDLSVTANYEKAYRGGFGEWVEAVWAIIQFNGFLDFLPTSSDDES